MHCRWKNAQCKCNALGHMQCNNRHELLFCTTKVFCSRKSRPPCLLRSSSAGRAAWSSICGYVNVVGSHPRHTSLWAHILACHLLKHPKTFLVHYKVWRATYGPPLSKKKHVAVRNMLFFIFALVYYILIFYSTFFSSVKKRSCRSAIIAFFPVKIHMDPCNHVHCGVNPMI